MPATGRASAADAAACGSACSQYIAAMMRSQSLCRGRFTVRLLWSALFLVGGQLHDGNLAHEARKKERGKDAQAC